MFKKIPCFRNRPLANQKGQALTEYITLVVLVALVGVGGAQALGKVVRKKINTATRHVREDINFDDVTGKRGRSIFDQDSTE